MYRKLIATIAALSVALVSTAIPTHGSPHRISPQQASRAALKKVHGKLVKPAALEHEDGKWQYEVLVRSGSKLMELDVDAITGKVIHIEKTSAKEEARELRSKH